MRNRQHQLLKKGMAFLLAAAMIMSSGASAFAEYGTVGEDNDLKTSKTYDADALADGTSTDGENPGGAGANNTSTGEENPDGTGANSGAGNTDGNVELSGPGGDGSTTEEPGDAGQGSGSALTITPSDETDYTFVFVWNDNSETPSTDENSTNEADRPGVSAFSEKLLLYFSLDGGATYQALTEDNMADLGLTSLPGAPACDSTSNTEKWTYTSTLPSKITTKTEGEEPTETNTEVLWQLIYTDGAEAADVNGYMASDPESKSTGTDDDKKVTVTTMYTAKQDWNATVLWHDKSVEDVARPDMADVNTLYKVYRYVNGKKDATLTGPLNAEGSAAALLTATETDADEWQLSLLDAPGWDEDGNPYVYYVEQADGDDLSKDVDTYGTYVSLFENVENYAPQTSALYINGTVTNRIEKETTYTIYKEWEDDNATDRPTYTVYLYRIIEKKTKTIAESAAEASPVRGYDSMTVPKDGDTCIYVDSEGEEITAYKIEFGVDETTGEEKLPMYDNRGNKYIYFGLEIGSGGDYVKVVDNALADESDSVIRAFDAIKNGASPKYVLDNGLITNDRESDITLSASKLFKAQSMQSFTDTTVKYMLQVGHEENGETVWENAGKDDVISVNESTGAVTDDSVIITISGFKGEAMGQTSSDTVVPKYDVNTGALLTYRWVEIAMAVDGGEEMDVFDADGNKVKDTDPNALAVDDDGKIEYAAVDVGLVAPGIGSETTTALFMPTTVSDSSIINTLQGGQQVKIRKTWTDENGTNVSGDAASMDGVTVTFTVSREDGWSEDVTMSIADLDESSNAWEKLLTGLDRFDENGKEFTYEISEAKISDPQNRPWGSDYTLENAVVTSAENDTQKVMQLTGNYTNSLGPGEELYFDIEKQWLDDSDILSREPVKAGVYRKGTDGTYTLVEEVTLNERNLWKVRVTVPRQGEDDTVDNYLVKEISVAGVSVTTDLSDAQIKEQAKKNLSTYTEGNRVGVLAEDTSFFKDIQELLGMEGYSLEYNYNSYLQETDSSDTRAYYLMTNQRVGEINLELTKTWAAGGNSMDAVFVLYRGDTEMNIKNLVEAGVATVSGDIVLNDDGSITLPGGTGKKKIEITINGLDKYAIDGSFYNYTLEERGIRSDGDEILFKNRMATVDGDTYVSTLSQDEDRTEIIGREGHHTGDTYVWTGSNVRKETYALTARKVWRDDGDSKRPDISFNVYRVSVQEDASLMELVKSGDTELLASALTSYADSSHQVVGDHLWDTKHNAWYWTADVGTVERYDSDGYNYIYFVQEIYTGNQGKYTNAYCNLDCSDQGYQPVAKPTDGDFTTKEVFETTDLVDTVTILADGYHKDALGDYGNYYSGTTVNTIQDTRTISGKKVWTTTAAYEAFTLDASELPDVEICLYCFDSPITDENGEEAAEITQEQLNEKIAAEKAAVVGTATLSNGKLSYKFTKDENGDLLKKYDEWGRSYYYYVSEKTVIDSYPAASITLATNDFTLTNVYDPSASDSQVDVKINKTWESNVEGKTATAPAEFKLKAIQQDKDGNPIGNAMTMATKAIVPGEDGTASLDFGEQPYYGTNNNPLLYWVEETKISGYTNEALTDGVYVGEQNPKSSGFVFLTLTPTTEDGSDKTIYKAEVSYKNTYVSEETTDISVSKEWAGDNGYYDNTAYRPSQITFEVWRKWEANTIDGVTAAGGDELYTTIVLSDGQWTYSENDVKQYAPNGKAYTYYFNKDKESVSEADAAKLKSYQATASGNNVKNTLITVSRKFTKTWKNSDGTTMNWETFKRLRTLSALPASITYLLQRSADGTTWEYLPKKSGDTVTEGGQNVCGKTYELASLTENNFQNMSATWDQLAKYVAGTETEYQYRVVEKMTWADGSSTTYYANGDAGNDDLQPASGAVYAAETADITVDGTTSKITNTVSDCQIKLTKTWAGDNGNRDDTRPDSVTLYLASNSGESLTFTVKKPAKSGSNNADGSTSDGYASSTSAFYIPLPDGVTASSSADEIAVALSSAYTVTEAAIPSVTTDDGQTFTYTFSTDGKFTAGTSANGVYELNCVNTGDASFRKVVSFSAKKTFAGDSAYTDLARATVRMTLMYQDAATGAWKEVSDDRADADNDCYYTNFFTGSGDPNPTVTIGSDNTGTVTFTGLKEYWERTDANAGEAEKIIYGVKEELIDKNGEVITTSSYTMSNSDTVKVENKGTASFTNTLNLKPLTIEKSWKNSDGQTLTKTQIEKMIHDKMLPSVITFELYAKSGDGDYVSTGKTMSCAVKDLAAGAVSWCQTDGDTNVDGVPQYDKNGNELSYQIREASWKYDGDSTEYTEKTDSAFTADTADASIADGAYAVALTNELQTTKISLEKIWDDEEDRDGVRPASITVTLKAHKKSDEAGDKDALIVEAQEIKADGNGKWTVTFDNLPVYADGEEVTYYVEETVTDDYDLVEDESVTSVDAGDSDAVKEGFVLTNTYDPQPTEVHVTKQWVDNNDERHMRPDSITITLYKNEQSGNGDEIVETRTIKPDEDGNWEYTFDNLKKYANQGKEILYSVEEAPVENYGATIIGPMNGEVTIVNRFGYNGNNAPTTVDVEAVKKWDDEELTTFGDYNRPNVTFILCANVNGETYDLSEILDESRTRAILSDENLEGDGMWHYTFTDLPEADYDTGATIHYFVVETEVAGYTTETVANEAENVYTITNTPSGEQQYEPVEILLGKVDADGGDPLAGAIFEVTKDGESYGVTEKTDDEGLATFTFTENGTYKISEKVAPAGYSLCDTTYTVEVAYGKILSFTKDEETGLFSRIYERVIKDEDGNAYEEGDVLEFEDTKIPAKSTNGSGAKTGDMSNAGLWAILMGLAVVVFTGVGLMRKKRR